MVFTGPTSGCNDRIPNRVPKPPVSAKPPEISRSIYSSGQLNTELGETHLYDVTVQALELLGLHMLFYS